MQGSLFFTLSVTQGIIVLVKDPYKGIKARSPRKATVGLIRGASGLVASPLIGALGFFSKSFDGVKATTHLLEKKVVESRCRPKRYSIFCTADLVESYINKTQIDFFNFIPIPAECQVGVVAWVVLELTS
jgi:hypothetical protein